MRNFFVISLIFCLTPLVLVPAQAQQAPAYCEKNGEMVFTKECIDALLSDGNKTSATENASCFTNIWLSSFQ